MEYIKLLAVFRTFFEQKQTQSFKLMTPPTEIEPFGSEEGYCPLANNRYFVFPLKMLADERQTSKNSSIIAASPALKIMEIEVVFALNEAFGSVHPT